MDVTAYLMFDGRCEEAFQFYERCLGGKIQRLVRYSDMPDCPPEMKQAVGDRIAHVNLKVDGCMLMGSDSGDPQKYPHEGYKGFSVCINSQDVDQAEKVFQALSEQATTITMPLSKTSWSERFGMLVDRYGVEWMVNVDMRG
ncbi:MAG TPA: VOC family protein [Dyella sp.]|uniref:VOC family protein n=1 Tax=Dyella sp. TaxID=1869338 RepID=UPI002F93E924